MLNANEGQPQLGSLGIPSGVDKGPSRGAEDLAATLQMEELNKQLEDAKVIARSTAPGMAHPYLNAVLGIVAQGLDPQIAGPAFQAGTQARMAPALDQYKEAVDKANSIIAEGERRQRAFQNILASNPDALIPLAPEGDIEAQKQLGLAAFGLPVPIDPGAKSRLRLADIQRKNLISYHLNTARMAQQSGNNTLAEEQMRAIEDLMDPSGESQIPVGSLVNRKQAMNIRMSEVINNYEEAGAAKDAWVRFQLTGDHDSFMHELGLLHVRQKADRAQTRMEKQIELTSQLAAHMDEVGEDDQTKALKGMPEAFQLQWDAVMPKGLAGSDELTRDDYLREYRAAYDDALSTHRALGDEPDQETLKAEARALARQRVRTAERDKAQANRSTRKVVGEAQKEPENQPAATPITLLEFQIKVDEYIKKHKEQDYHAAALAVAAQLGDKTPPQVRKKLGI